MTSEIEHNKPDLTSDALQDPIFWAKTISRICAEVDPESDAEKVNKRIQFLCYEFAASLSPGLSSKEILSELNEFFFEDKEFSVVPDESYSDPAPLYFLNRILASRVGSGLAVSLIYSCLANAAGLRLQFVDLRPACFLKYVRDGASQFVDLSRTGKFLSSAELIDLVAKRFQNVSREGAQRACEVLSFERFAVDYISALKLAYQRRGDTERLLYLQNHLLNFQPSNLNLVAERAVLNRKLGKFKSAMTDLKRYFAFHDRGTASVELVRLFEELQALLQKNPAQMELVD